MKELGVGLLGFGTVGEGVVRGLLENGDLLAERSGVRAVLRKIADIDLDRKRGVSVDASVLTTDAAAVVADPAVDIVVELIGGTGVARDLVLQALKAGKPVVTANKALLAEHGEEIFGLAGQQKTDLYFGASVGGGIPIIRALREGLIANRIESIYGILNGTCNYILTRMEAEGLPFDQALAQAQAEGYAEADPGLDIDGIDTAHKAVILASLAHGDVVPMDAAYVEGIRGLSEEDICYARDLGYRIKLLAIVRRDADGVQLRVHPTLLPVDHVLASVSGVFNAVMVHGNMVGDTLYYGRGAGEQPTASTVIANIVDVARNLAAGVSRHVPAVAEPGAGVTVKSIDAIETRYYLRLSLKDQPGMLGRIASILGEQGISIASVVQKEARDGGHVAVVIVTHEALDCNMTAALESIDQLAAAGAPTVRLRIEAP